MMTGKKTPLGIAFLIFALVASGCGPIVHSRAFSLAGSGDHAQLVKEFEPLDRNFSQMPFSELIYLCSAYAELKNYQNLLPCIDAAQEKVAAGDCHADLWDHSSFPLRMKAVAYIELGQYAEAIKAGEASYQIIIDKHLERYDQVKTLEVLGVAYGLAGMKYKAEAVIESIKTVLNEGAIGSLEDDINIALARIYITLNEYQDAIDILYYKFEESNTLVKAITGWDAFMGNKIQFEFMKNKSFFEVGRLAEAKEGYDILLRYPYILNHGEIYWNILFDLGRIAKKEGNVVAAINFYTRAVEVIEQQRASINTEASKIGFVGDKQALYHNLVRALYQDGRYGTAFEYVERAKSRALVDLLASKKDFAVKGGDEKEINKVLAMNDSVAAAAIFQDASIDKSKTRSIQVKAKEALKRLAPELASLVSVTSLPITELQALIPGDEALIEYYYYDQNMYAFILSDGKMQAVELDGNGLNAEIQQFRKSIETFGSMRFRDNAKKLYKRLFQPLESLLNSHRLIIIPHGALHYLPMNALHDGNGYLVDRYSIRMMPSASAIKYLREGKSNKSGGILIFGNPDLGDPSNDLEYAQKEAMALAAIRPQSRVLLRKEATEGALRQYGHRYSYIHFATHGRFNPQEPLQSALLLAPDSQHNGKLTVDKIYSLNLNANLVTLSACETGLGKITTGDDLLGLTRGFLYAGCSSIVASLWKVDDLATAYLMSRFYSELDKTDKQEALRRAQLETKRKYPHPYYWASFVLTGSAK
jgi:CHAT domain-containing protein